MDRDVTPAPQELRTARLLLRPFRTADVPSIVRLAGAREVAGMTTRIPHPYTQEDAKNFLEQTAEESRAGRSAVFAITNPSGSELYGSIGLVIAPAHHNAELGYWIGVPYWGRGFATEAAAAVIAYGFETLGLHRILAHCFGGNTASQRVLEKIGMRHEGKLRQHVHKWDRFVDLEVYGLLAADFRGEK